MAVATLTARRGSHVITDTPRGHRGPRRVQDNERMRGRTRVCSDTNRACSPALFPAPPPLSIKSKTGLWLREGPGSPHLLERQLEPSPLVTGGTGQRRPQILRKPLCGGVSPSPPETRAGLDTLRERRGGTAGTPGRGHGRPRRPRTQLCLGSPSLGAATRPALEAQTGARAEGFFQAEDV